MRCGLTRCKLVNITYFRVHTAGFIVASCQVAPNILAISKQVIASPRYPAVWLLYRTASLRFKEQKR
jgi:hypothetical protein